MDQPKINGSTPAFDQLQQGLLGALKQSPDYISGEDLAARVGLSRAAVWKRIQRLKTSGYQIEGSPRRGYRLQPQSDLLLPGEIALNLQTNYFKGPFYHFLSLASTNDLAKELARQGFPEGTTLVAEGQTGGRGRLGRIWESPAGEGLYVSLILRPSLPPAELPKITLMAAVAVVRALERVVQVKAGIKWPNDIILQGKKLGGILTEMETESDQMSHLVLGLGLNINTASFPPPLAPFATSLALEGCSASRLAILKAWLESLDSLYEGFLSRQFSAILDSWRQASVTLGKEVSIRLGNRTISGRALDLNQDGVLLVETASGRIEYVISGEIALGPPILATQEA